MAAASTRFPLFWTSLLPKKSNYSRVFSWLGPGLRKKIILIAIIARSRYLLQLIGPLRRNF